MFIFLNIRTIDLSLLELFFYNTVQMNKTGADLFTTKLIYNLKQ